MENYGRIRKLMTGLAMVALSNGALADTTPVLTSVSSAPAPVTAAALIGVLDLRPSYVASSKTGYSENSIEAGYKFNKTVSLSYVQFFNTNIFDPNAGPEKSGAQLTFPGSFLRTRVGKIYEKGNFDIGLQNRIYIPTGDERAKGKITSVRQYFNFNQKVNDTLSFTAAVIPIGHVYSQASAGGKANPAFENRVYLITNVNLTEKLSLSVPVMFHQSKARLAEGAAGSSTWTFFAWINPELGYQINDNVAVGIGYYSDNLVKSDLSGFDLRNGLSAGITQVFATMNL